jgi:YD repeat-containing protein
MTYDGEVDLLQSEDAGGNYTSYAYDQDGRKTAGRPTGVRMDDDQAARTRTGRRGLRGAGHARRRAVSPRPSLAGRRSCQDAGRPSAGTASSVL